jgi:peptide deformylase
MKNRMTMETLEIMEILEIRQVGDPILQAKAPLIGWIAAIQSPAIQQLIDGLIATVKSCNGVGIAAPQVGHSLQLMIIASHPSDRYPHAPVMDPTAMINPMIVAYSQTTEKDWEGCLSVPDQRGQVTRYSVITVGYTDRWGQNQEVELTGFVARIFQHEYDHLQGLVFLDRIEQADALISEVAYQELIKID